ncbi:MAG: glycosyltransferase involved in cell wall biosynthesis [Sulfurimonas sp.]|jgi:glycosyltransferase involved in cell wall biosynthesis
MFVSVIIPTYKDVEALELILGALKLQTYKNFEVIIAEDNDSQEVINFLKDYKSDYKIKHFSHSDDGYQKPRALNEAIKVSSGYYLIFFDGDCLPYSNFLEAHVKASDEKKVLCGRRVNLGDVFSRNLRSKNLYVEDLEHNFLKYYFKIKRDGARHLECGIRIISSLKFQKLLKSEIALIGCNFSLHKDNLLKVNGFDESYPKNTTLADDVDLEWRLKAIDLSVESVKYTAHLLHLNHPRANRVVSNIDNLKVISKNKAENKFFCKDGILKS